MKWILLIVAVLSGGGIFGVPAGYAETAALVKLKNIACSFDSEGKEIVSFSLAQNVQPKMFAMNGEHPRLVLDFPETSYKGKNLIPVKGGQLVSAIRVGWHDQPAVKIRVVVDIKPGRKFTYRREYSDADKRLVVTLAREGAAVAQAGAEAADEAADEVQKENLPAQKLEVLESKAHTQKPVTPVLAKQEEPVTVAAQEQEQVVVPVQEQAQDQVTVSVQDPVAEPKTTGRLIGITFDSSSNRGEMVLFHLNDFFPPTVSAIEKNNPRVICDFLDMDIAPDLEKNLYANGRFVERVLTEVKKNPDRVQVTLELSPNRDYDLQQVFFKNDNLFVLIVNELGKEEVKQPTAK